MAGSSPTDPWGPGFGTEHRLPCSRTSSRHRFEGVIVSAAGLTNSGKIAATLQAVDGSSRAVLLSPVLRVEPPKEIFNPESGTELEGSGEAVGCDAISGWVIDRKHPQMNVPLEMYEDTRLIAGGIAEQRRADGTWGFRIAVPLAIQDGNSHFVNVRFGAQSNAPTSPGLCAREVVLLRFKVSVRVLTRAALKFPLGQCHDSAHISGLLDTAAVADMKAMAGKNL